MDIENSDVLAEHVPLLAHAASHVGDPQVRHRGTIGGSIAHADPASDLPATTLALGATYVAQGPSGTREIAAADFYESFLTSTLGDDELLTEIRVPKMQGAGWSFQKFNRRAQDWAIVGVAAWRRNGDAGVGLVNMGSTPILATSVASALAGGASVEEAAEQAAAEADPQADLNASVEYRIHLAKVLTRRALEAATSGVTVRAGGYCSPWYVPPSTWIWAPVRKLACRPHRKATMAPKSSGAPSVISSAAAP